MTPNEVKAEEEDERRRRENGGQRQRQRHTPEGPTWNPAPSIAAASR